jgi:hypothetical protein
MKMMRQALMAATLAAFNMGATAPALAQQAAGVSVGQLSYQLIDLTPDDGIDPWIGVNSYATLAYAHVYDQEGKEIEGTEIGHAGTAGFDNAYASLHLKAEDDRASVLLTLHSGYGFVSASRSFRFVLSPNTQVVFSADADMWATPEAPGVSWPTAIAELYGSLHGINDGERFSSSLYLEDGTQHGRLSITAASEGEWVDGYLAFDAYAVAESHALPVPEPAPALMLLAGLALAGALGRFARQR